MNKQKPEQHMLLRLFRFRGEDGKYEDQRIVRVAVREN